MDILWLDGANPQSASDEDQSVRVQPRMSMGLSVVLLLASKLVVM